MAVDYAFTVYECVCGEETTLRDHTRICSAMPSPDDKDGPPAGFSVLLIFFAASSHLPTHTTTTTSTAFDSTSQSCPWKMFLRDLSPHVFSRL
jgi:hypothetical protein